MSDEKVSLNGKCLCGCVTALVDTASTKVGVCHCSMCRNWGGGPLHALDCGTQVVFTGLDNVAEFNSSAWATRGFCKACGTHLYYKIRQTGQHIMPVGLFSDLPELIFDHQIFIDEKPAYYCYANETHNMTGAEVFAQFGA